MGKINWDKQTQPSDSPDVGKVYMYIDSADDLLTLKLSDSSIDKYLTSANITLEQARLGCLWALNRVIISCLLGIRAVLRSITMRF